MTEHLIAAATVFLVLFAAVGAYDGLYLHLWKYRLYAREETRYEHGLHTAVAFLSVPVVWLLFAGNFGGLALWAGVFFVAVSFVVEMMDVLEENDSRASLGGLSREEYAAHVVAITTRVAAVALALAAKPMAAWSLSSPLVLEAEYPAWVAFVGEQMLFGNVVVGALHLWLMRSRYRVPSQALRRALRCCEA
jgi:hypothetical protein